MNKEIPNKYKVITTLKEVDELITYVKATRIMSFDFETSDLNMFDEEQYITTVSISFQPGSSYVIPLFHFESPFSKKDALYILKYLGRELWENTKIVKIGWNIKFEHKWLKRYGVELRGRLFDGSIARYYLDENLRAGLKENVALLIPEYDGYDEAVDIAKKKYGGWSKIPLDILAPYNALDTDLTLRLMLHYHARLIEHGFYKLFRNLRMMAAVTLAEAEFAGARVNVDHLKANTEKYKTLIEEKWAELMAHDKVRKFIRKRKARIRKDLIESVRAEIKELREQGRAPDDRMIKHRQNKILNYQAGTGYTKKIEENMEFNFNSSQQVADLFFNSEHGFQFPILKRTDSGAPSTDEATLLLLQKKDKTGFIQQLLDLRGLEKMNSTYIEGMWKHLDKNNYVHSSYKVAHTVTHRLSSEGPNIQNVPRILTNPDVKPMFEPPAGYLHLEHDYGQAELRIAAELSKDKTMIDIFARGYNIHVATAVRATTGSLDAYDDVRAILKDENHPENEYWERQKKKAKVINFGILYGQGDPKLAEGMGVSLNEAKKFKAQWFKSYPQLVKWIQQQVKYAKKHGYVYSIWGYKRRLPDIWHAKPGVRAEAERQAVNAPIQGAASDYTLFSSVILRQMRLRGELPKYFILRMIVHDALDFYVLPKDLIWLEETASAVMMDPSTEKYFGFKMKYVKMKAGGEVGLNWGHKGDIKKDVDYGALVAQRDKRIKTIY